MFCPNCKDEFREGFTFCRKCNVDLVKEEFVLDEAMEYNLRPFSKLVTIYKKLFNPWQFSLVNLFIFFSRLLGIIVGLTSVCAVFALFSLYSYKPHEGSCIDGNTFLRIFVLFIIPFALIFPYKFVRNRLFYYLFIIVYTLIFIGVVYTFTSLTAIRMDGIIPYPVLILPLIVFGSNFWAFFIITRRNFKK